MCNSQLPVSKLECIVGFGHHPHASYASRLNIATREVKTIADDSTGQPMPGIDIIGSRAKEREFSSDTLDVRIDQVRALF